MQRNQKIRDLDDLALTRERLRAEGKRVVHSHGVFDLVHLGHIRHLEEAKSLGDVLIVTVTQDSDVRKGPNRPAFPQDARAEVVASFGMVDCVAINRWPLAVETIKLLKPDVYVKGPDYKVADNDVTRGIILEAEAVRSVGGEIRFTDDVVFSSSALLNRHFRVFSDEVEQYLDGFRKRHSTDEVLSWLDQACRVRPLAIGEPIIDEYVFCDAIGKSMKDPVLAALLQTADAYAGGSLAVANHLAGLCPEVVLVAQLGDTDRREDFVRAKLRPNIDPTFVTKSKSPTIHKRRFVERYSGSKLLEIYIMADHETSGSDCEALCAAARNALRRVDVAVAADYGHGAFVPQLVSTVSTHARFLAINVQSNAGNRGFNSISKYPRADYVCLAAHEVALETRRRNGSLREAILQLTKAIDCSRFTVTQGKEGMLHYTPTSGFTEVPALATKVVDRVGAGDAVLAVTSLLALVGAPWDIIGFIGNIAGAELVRELGNQRSLERVDLSRHIVAVLK